MLLLQTPERSEGSSLANNRQGPPRTQERHVQRPCSGRERTSRNGTNEPAGPRMLALRAL